MWFCQYNQIVFILMSYCIIIANGQYLNNTLIWCTVSQSEQDKCESFARAVKKDAVNFGLNYLGLQCKKAFNKEECMTWLDREEAQVTSLDAGELFLAGRFHSIVPIMQEIYDKGLSFQYAVAVIKKDSLLDVQNLRNLKGKKACFAKVDAMASWIIPIYTLMKHGELEIIDCNNHIKSAINYFGPSCAINSLVNENNPLGDNSDKLCELCIGGATKKCTSLDPYAGYEGAFRCLVEKGDVAFLVHTTVSEMTSTTFDFTSVAKEQFELLCRDGTRESIDDFSACNWGVVPSRAIVTSSTVKPEFRRQYQKFFEKAIHLFNENSDKNEFINLYSDEKDSDNQHFENETMSDSNTNNNNNPNRFRDSRSENFRIFESAPKYGQYHNLMFSDVTRDFASINEKNQNYENYLGRSLDLILGVRDCPVKKMTLCVTSDAEMNKCVKMKVALNAQLMKPELFCYKGHSQINCMQAIRSGLADVTVLDASDVYTAGLRYELIPFIAEIYALGTPDYYVVAVVKEEDKTTDLTYLKNKNTCHVGISTAAGWVYPMAYLISNNWIRGYGCDSIRAAAEYFMKSCIPGAHNIEYNTGVPYDNMCDLCHGTNFRYCRRDVSEEFYGHTGALRCLVEGGGDVAFVKHTTIAENSDGKRREIWSRNILKHDFQLLCTDGTRRSSSDFADCNLGKVASNAIVTRGGRGYNKTQIDAYINLFIYAETFYGRKEQDEFNFAMFHSALPYSDLIFQDATQKFYVIPPEKRQFRAYLGKDFIRAKKIVDCNADIISGTIVTDYSVLSTFFIILIAFILST